MIKLKIGISNGTHAKFGDNGYEKLRELGFTHIDYNVLCNQTHGIYKGGNIEQLLSPEKAKIAGAGLTVFQTHGPWDYHRDGDTPEQINEMYENLKICIKANAFLGVKYIAVHPFFPHGEMSSEGADEDLELNVKLFKELLPLLEEYDVTLCIENLPWPLAVNGYPARVLELIERLDDPHYAACLDTGHSMSCKVQPGDAVKTLGKHLKITHIHDNEGGGDQHKFPYDKNCKIDWVYFSKSMKEIGYDGVFNLETAPEIDLPYDVYVAKLQYLKKITEIIAKAAE